MVQDGSIRDQQTGHPGLDSHVRKHTTYPNTSLGGHVLSVVSYRTPGVRRFSRPQTTTPPTTLDGIYKTPKDRSGDPERDSRQISVFVESLSSTVVETSCTRMLNGGAYVEILSLSLMLSSLRKPIRKIRRTFEIGEQNFMDDSSFPSPLSDGKP